MIRLGDCVAVSEGKLNTRCETAGFVKLSERTVKFF